MGCRASSVTPASLKPDDSVRELSEEAGRDPELPASTPLSSGRLKNRTRSSIFRRRGDGLPVMPPGEWRS